MGIPVVIAANGRGLPVKQVASGAPVMTVAANGRGIPIVLGNYGAPFVVQGGTPTPTVVDKIITAGDSIIFAGGEGNNGAAYQFRDMSHPGKTVVINAQNTRTVGGPDYGGGADTGTPTGNTMLLHRDEDIATAAQAMIFMIGTNDLLSKTAAQYIADLTAYAPPIRAAGTKLYWSYPIALGAGYAEPGRTNWMAKRATIAASARDPSYWGAFADGYWPLGEQAISISADNVHPDQPGQDAMFIYMKAIGLSLFDDTRVSSDDIYTADFPTSQINLTPSTTYNFRVVVSGLRPEGTNLGASVSGASATIALNGGTPGTAVGKTSGNGYRIYNGDTLDFAVPLSASNNTAVSVDIQIGATTLTRTFRTVAAVTPATYAHQDVLAAAVADNHYTWSGLAFDNIGMAVIAVHSSSAATAVTVGGVSATLRRTRTGSFVMTIWTVPIAATGARNVDINFTGFTGAMSMSWGVVKDADSTPTQIDPASNGTDGSDSQPFQTGSLTVPANGIAVAFFGEYGGGSSVTPATTNSGTTFVDEGQVGYNGEVSGIAVGKRTTTGTASFNFSFGAHPRGAIVFKAFGT